MVWLTPACLLYNAPHITSLVLHSSINSVDKVHASHPHLSLFRRALVLTRDYCQQHHQRKQNFSNDNPHKTSNIEEPKPNDHNTTTTPPPQPLPQPPPPPTPRTRTAHDPSYPRSISPAAASHEIADFPAGRALRP